MPVAEASLGETSGLDAAALLPLTPVALTKSQRPPVSSGLKPNAAAFAVSLALHACLAIGVLRLAADGSAHGVADLETPIEIVVAESAAAADERLESGQPLDVQANAERASATGPATADEPPTAEAPPNIEARAADATAVPPAASPEGPPPAPAEAAAPEPAPAPDAAQFAAARQTRLHEQIEKQRAERERRHALEISRRQAEARAREQERRRQAARHAEQRAREDERERAAERAQAHDERRRAAARAEERRRVAHAAAERQGAGAREAPGRAATQSPAARSRAGDDGAFDASAYRAMVARAVRAAVGSRCSQGAGSRVVVALVIGRTGAVSSAAIASSSGNSAFDAASAAAVRSAGPFPAPTGRSAVNVPVAVSCR